MARQLLGSPQAHGVVLAVSPPPERLIYFGASIE